MCPWGTLPDSVKEKCDEIPEVFLRVSRYKKKVNEVHLSNVKNLISGRLVVGDWGDVLRIDWNDHNNFCDWNIFEVG